MKSRIYIESVNSKLFSTFEATNFNTLPDNTPEAIAANILNKKEIKKILCPVQRAIRITTAKHRGGLHPWT